MKSSVEQVLRQVESAILLFGPDGRLQIAGEASERLLARPRGELLGRPLSDLFPEWTGPGAALSKAIASRQWLRDHPVTLERSNMPPAKLLMTIEPVQYDEGAATGTLVMLRDAGSRNERRADSEIARRLVALSRLTSGVAHEIKNPLNAMMLHLEIAADKATRGQDTTPELSIVKRELLRLDRVVKTLLDFHRPVEVQTVECRFGVLASEVAALIKPQADAQNVRVLLEDNAPEVRMLGDTALLKQSILNVAVNSLEAMRTGGVLKFVTHLADNNECVLTIEDTGAGIPPEIRDKIFNLYFTTKQSGSGIGLAMAYRIMQLHGGSITIDSDPGTGTACRLAIPVTQSREVAA
jgi:signal transduction histidine kinase